LGEDGATLLEGSQGLLLDGLRVPEHLVKAAQAVLGEKVGFVVAKNPREIALRFAAKRGEKSKTALGILTLVSGELESFPVSTLELELPLLLDSIEVSPEFKGIAQKIFSNTYVVSTIDDAYETLAGLSPQVASDVTLVTEAGELVSAESFFAFDREGGLLQIKAKAEKLQLSLEEKRGVFEALQKEKSALQEQASAAELRHKEALTESQKRASQIRELVQQQGNTRGRLHAERKLTEELIGDIRRLEDQRAQTERRISELQNDEVTTLEEMSRDTGEQEVELREEVSKLAQESAALDEKRRAGRDRLSTVANKVHEVRRELDRARSQVSSANLQVQKIEIEMSHTRERLVEALGVETLKELDQLNESERRGARLEDSVRNELQGRRQQIRSRIDREGDVDPDSIEQYELESARLEELENQRSDLQEAHRTLQKTIEKLSEVSVQRFVSTFEAVNENYSKLIPRLFGGGSAYLELLDPSNPLESGVEIHARPPGKKLKSMELLSGGEKALCAISLIFAMFMERPSPLLVLDEVDAPLDEANVIRFLNLIKEMAKQTQVLAVTHNKQSMAVCDNLIGVTMEQPGASRVVTVTLEQAYQHAVNE
ncbi:MAG: hypothetical protein KDD53_01050, partial [Bdellovibrionales bacterium]|nr:hypothetical protein [Bdellovibrionales bacterium]